MKNNIFLSKAYEITFERKSFYREQKLRSTKKEKKRRGNEEKRKCHTLSNITWLYLETLQDERDTMIYSTQSDIFCNRHS